MSASTCQCLLLCELLWDCFPDREMLGGATLNVAYHLKHCGIDPIVASSVGDDHWGREALRQIREEWRCDTSAIRVLSEWPTGRVIVTLDEKGDGSYEILTPAAWDFVSLGPDILRNIGNVRAFVYGSVGLRSEFNRKQVNRFLRTFKGLKFFDVNFRPPHNHPAMIAEYATKADFVKMNEEELHLLSSGLEKGIDIESRMRWLARRLAMDTLCVTRAERSAVLLRDDDIFYGNTFAVDVEDTVGAGDAFFASMISDLLWSAFDPVEALNRATALGSWVASKKGPQPAYPMC